MRSSNEDVEKLERGTRILGKHSIAMKSAKFKQDGELWLFWDCDKCFEIEKGNDEVETFYQ